MMLCSGYMAPEYAIDGLFSVKSDVFSFGILILEIISGKRNRGLFHSNQNLIGHVSFNSSTNFKWCLIRTSVCAFHGGVIHFKL